MAEQITLRWNKDGYSFTIDGAEVSFAVRSASMRMEPGKAHSVVIEIDAENVQMEHGYLGAPICGDGTTCILPIGHQGDHEHEPVDSDGVLG